MRTLFLVLLMLNLALFAWVVPALPDPKTLVCTEFFVLADGTGVPEFDRFGIFLWDEALTRVGKNMARVLAALRREAIRGASN